jgi:hypothetical protein
MKLLAISICILEITQMLQAANITSRLPPKEVERLGGLKNVQEAGGEWEQYKAKNSKFLIFIIR